MDVRWGWFRSNKKVFANRAEQDIINREFGFLNKGVYIGDEATAIYLWLRANPDLYDVTSGSV